MTDALQPPADPLAAFPAHRSEIRIGYARVSTAGQNLDRTLVPATSDRGRCRMNGSAGWP